jgi:hemerythrin superfamily protein
VIARGLADLRLVADALPEPQRTQRSELVRVAVVLFGRFEQHALEEELDIYPDVSRLLGDRRLAAAMTYDHRALKAAAAELAGIDPLDDPRLQALLYGLHTLLVVHREKEEEFIFPMLEEQTTERAPLLYEFDALKAPIAAEGECDPTFDVSSFAVGVEPNMWSRSAQSKSLGARRRIPS